MGKEYVDYAAYTDGVFDNLGSWEDVDIRGLLERTQATTKERLERELDRINEELDDRESIHQ